MNRYTPPTFLTSGCKALVRAGRVAQRESTPLTWEGSQVQSLSCPPFLDDSESGRRYGAAQGTAANFCLAPLAGVDKEPPAFVGGLSLAPRRGVPKSGFVISPSFSGRTYCSFEPPGMLTAGQRPTGFW
jgi:hypothetical protein